MAKRRQKNHKASRVSSKRKVLVKSSPVGLRMLGYAAVLTALVVVIFLFFGKKSEPLGSEGLFLNSSDGWQIAASYYHPPTAMDNHKGMVLLSTLGGQRDSYQAMAMELAYLGYNVIAIDLRGHGDSTNQGTWKEMSIDQMNNMPLDAVAAVKYLKEQGITNISLIGSDIGANVALKVGTYDYEIDRLVLLSPGMIFRAVDITNEVSKVDKKVLVVVGEGDLYSYEAALNIRSSDENAIIYVVPGTSLRGENLLREGGTYNYIVQWVTT